MKKAYLIILIFLLSSITFAQEDSWPLETACIEAVSPMPADWHFSGTILIRGYAGIHGYQQGWDTPRVLISEAQMPDALTEFGSFSPDYQWFAYFAGYVSTDPQTWSSHAWISGLQLINVDEPSEGHYFQHLGTIYGFYDTRPVPIWIDSERLFLAGDNGRDNTILNIATDEMQATGLFYPSLYPESLNVLPPDGSQFWPHDSAFLFWLPDGNGYLRTWHESDLSPFYFLSIKQGETEQVIWNLPENQRIQSGIGGFSRDGRYAAFLVEQFKLPDNEYVTWLVSYGEPILYVLDLQEQRIINTCLTVHDYGFYSDNSLYGVPRSAHWASDNPQLAFLSQQFYKTGDNLIPIRVFDLERYQLYTVAYHLDLAYEDSFVIGWRPE